MMKQIFLIVFSLILSFNSFSQSPQGFNYQAIVRDANGNIRSNQGVQFIFEIIDGTGNTVYTEFHTVVTNKYGLVDDIIIGNGASSDNFSNINWGSGIFFLNVNIDGVDMGATQLLSVPYALYALNAGTGGGGADGVGISSTVDNNDGTFTLNYTDGTSFTTINMTGPGGKSAYESWLSSGGVGSENDFLLSLKGADGVKGDKGEKGDKGDKGDPGLDGMGLGDVIGAASSVIIDNLDTSRVVVSNLVGKIAVSGISSNELNTLDNINSNIQIQINNKQELNQNLSDISSLDPTDGSFIVGDGTKFEKETPSEVLTTLGLGNIVTQDSTDIIITGGTITGITDITIADGGTGASTPAAARFNLNVDIKGTDNSTDVSLAQVPSNYLSISGQEITSGVIPIELGGTASTSAAGSRANLRLGSIATQDSTDISITGGKIIDITDLAVADGGTGASTAFDARTNLGVAIGYDVQAYDSEIAAVAGLTSAANKGIQFTGSGTAATYDLTSAGKALLDDADAATQRTTLGVDSAGTDNSTDVTLANTSYLSISEQEITGGTVPVASGGTGASTAANARTNLGVDVSGTDNSTPVTLAVVNANYLSLSGQKITSGTVPISLGGTGATSAANVLTNLGITATASEINLIDNSSAGTIVNSKAVIYGSSGEVNATTLQIGGTSITSDAAELNVLDGVTDVSAAEINYLDGVTSSVQTQINNKQATIIGAASTIVTDNLTSSRAMMTNGSGKVAVSDVTDTELSYLGGVTSNIQDQLDDQSSITGLSDALVENNSIWLGNDPSSTTDNATKNVGVGVDALDAITLGDENTAVGYDALSKLTEGHKNVAIGVGALSELTNGHGNMAVGYNALNNVVGGTGNVALGRQSLTGVTSGSKNVAIGRQSGKDVDNSVISGGADLTTGEKNTYIGAHTQPSANNVSNELVIGYGSTGKGTNTVVLGNSSVTEVYASEDAGATIYAAGLNLGGMAVTSTAAELNILDASATNSVSSDGASSNGNFTSNNYKISHTFTIDGNLADGAVANDITITNNKVLTTSVIIASASINVHIDVHTVISGSFKVRITNKSGAQLNNDSTIIINYIVL